MEDESHVIDEMGSYSILPDKLLGEVSSYALGVYWVLAYSQRNGNYYPSKEKIATLCRISISDVAEALGELVDKGFIS